eukprot:TRINITY_DN10446_c0_g1_i1.p1 TRINITY_DN10446_c0_g1~~TRINITY_DN10446_c0_g1_i1.p1  ORF type:complete len:459 (+),score=49.68 TRINITY_DN10446_c0_g1_i1:188-1378(+)
MEGHGNGSGSNSESSSSSSSTGSSGSSNSGSDSSDSDSDSDSDSSSSSSGSSSGSSSSSDSDSDSSSSGSETQKPKPSVAPLQTRPHPKGLPLFNRKDLSSRPGLAGAGAARPTLSSGTATSRQVNMMAHPVFLTPLTTLVSGKLQRVAVDSLGADFVRYFPQSYIVEDGKEIWQRTSDLKNVEESREFQVRKFLLCLASQFKDNTSYSKIEEKFFTYIPDGASLAGSSTAELYNTFFKTEMQDGPLMRALKYMQQGIAAPSVMRLKFYFLSNYNVQYFDCRGQWNIRFSFKDTKRRTDEHKGEHKDDNSTEQKIIRISHIKWEETKPINFEFCWVLSVYVNPEVNEILEAKLKIKHIKWVVDVTNDHRETVFSSLKDLYDPSKDPYNKMSRSVVP